MRPTDLDLNQPSPDYLELFAPRRYTGPDSTVGGAKLVGITSRGTASSRPPMP